MLKKKKKKKGGGGQQEFREKVSGYIVKKGRIFQCEYFARLNMRN